MLEPDAAQMCNPERLAPWMDQHVPEAGNGPIQATILTGGATNIVMRIERGGIPVVLRRPPLTPRPDSAKVLSREARVLSALNGTGVPAPRFYAACETQDVIGAPFYLMENIVGWLALGEKTLPDAFKPAEIRRQMPFALIGGIARLSTVDYKAVGLEGFGKPDGFLERQVDRWLHQHASYAESEGYGYRPLPHKDEVVSWLRANTPAMPRAGIIHGDYGWPNALMAPDLPVRLAAMIDWELSTIGDPLIDLGWLMYSVPSERSAVEPPKLFQDPAYPKREELVDHYAAVSGRPVAHLTYYMILAQFKLAMLLERHYARGLNGRLPRDKGEEMGALVLELLRSAAEMGREHDGQPIKMRT
ncbi:aminoglycoside phosphotransferase (APT) family kinase protein [Sphingobium wenxiniae]|uniref:Aminoglycoside phosphotransferase (APT) family kinase protein n=1 Tax=Sphingobium wenxiniae (strain DSM 21828 / CGMCC 1.7748 / JZ-1) TaxID=595605 RepID=A0A562KIC0_SPHWJ|nr:MULTISPECIES: phosphotransferase family protein [Sphingobium]MBB6190452.1 aminoglycoside phosphotransferase (APT) family kinase protein [Sphingobium wenxiniae]TWH95169.1 aminoglycoside phosphotransferase (APT) family kinase protein [Sphingobium wenxiniae]WRD78156.1 phosphotransferase family protein [Sphingobium baderi]